MSTTASNPDRVQTPKLRLEHVTKQLSLIHI